MRGEFIDVGGARLYYYAAGSRGVGEPIVFIHGFPTSSHLWCDVVPCMPEGHRVVVPDLLGYGRSDRPDEQDVGIKGHAERIIALLDTLRISYASIVGHDVGGGIAQYLAIKHPTRVARLALIDSVAFDDWPTRNVKLAKASLPLTRHLPATWILSILRGDLQRGYTDQDRGARSVDIYIRPFSAAKGRDVLVEHMLSLDPADTEALTTRLKDIVAPTAIVWGAHDPFLPTAIAKRLHESIPGSTLDIIPDARHFTPEEAPETIGKILTQWLDR
ncbi:MAG TPA: alpha/beta fold hydrolase [Gemmatimonadaceae bacterium]